MLRSTFYGFGIAASGMSMSQKYLDLTANNMSNMYTTGYTRQRLDLNSLPSANYTDRYAPYNNIAIGRGVNVTAVSQIRDPFLDTRFRREASNIGELDANLSAMTDISNVFDQVKSAGLAQAFQDFMTQMQRYSGQVGEVTIDTTVREAANTVLRMFQQYSNQLAGVREYQELTLTDSAMPEVNKLIENIAMLNRNIRECEIYGNPALELKDMRNLALDQLSAYMKIEVIYTPDKDFPGVEICSVAFISDNPATDNFSLDTRTLIKGKEFAQLEAVKNPVTDAMEISIVPPSPDSKLYPPGTNLAPITGQVPIQFTSGALKGSLDMLNANGAFDDPSTVNGIGYYEKILDQLVSDFAGVFNKANEYAYIDPITGVPMWGTDHPLFEADDGTSVITAKNIRIAQDWVDGKYMMTTTNKLPTGPDDDVSGDTSNLEYIISLMNKSFNFTTEGIDSTSATAKSVYTGTFEQVFNNIGLIAAQDTKAKTQSLEANTNVIKGIEDLRNSLSSVSMDEEGVNLLMFQKAYAASARVMTTLDEALEVLINRMGIVGR